MGEGEQVANLHLVLLLNPLTETYCYTTHIPSISFNVEGLSTSKTRILRSLNADVLCIQEMHKTFASPRIPGMHLVVYHPSLIHGSVIYACDVTQIKTDGVEVLKIQMDTMIITSVYKPPPTPWKWP